MILSESYIFVSWVLFFLGGSGGCANQSHCHFFHCDTFHNGTHWPGDSWIEFLKTIIRWNVQWQSSICFSTVFCVCLWIDALQDFIQKSKPRGQNTNKQVWSGKEAAAAITIITRSWQTFLGSASALLVRYIRNTANKCFPFGFPRYHQYFSVALLRCTLNSAHTTGTNARCPLSAWAQASQKNQDIGVDSGHLFLINGILTWRSADNLASVSNNWICPHVTPPRRIPRDC